MSNMEKRIDTFIDEASTNLYGYLHHPTFRAAVLSNLYTVTRVCIGSILDSRIENETIAWQEKHIDDIFHETMLKDLLKKHENIRRSLHSVKNNLKGFRTPFDVDNWGDRTVSLGLIKTPREHCLFSSFLGNPIVSHPPILLTIVTTGIMGSVVLSGLAALNVLDDFETVCRNAFHERIDDLTMDIVKRALKNKYVEEIQKTISTFFEGELKKEIIMIKENISTMRDKHDSFNSVKGTLSSLQMTVAQKIEHLKQIGCIDIITE